MSHLPFRASYLILLLSALLTPTASIPIDNGVESEPEIDCGAGYIGVTFSLRNNFDGHVYAKGHYNESQCRTDQTGRRMAAIRLSFNSCGVQRTRSLNPNGISVGAVVVITFHHKFITKVDRAYAVQCFYMEADKPVTVQLEVSELTTLLRTRNVPMPICRYAVLDGTPSGPPVHYVTVGQQVYHKWTCETDTANIFCMFVNSCYVSDGVSENVQILDSTGCAVDKYVLQNLEYINDLTAGQEAHVFKFADRAALYFQCQIGIVVRDPRASCPRPTCTTVPEPITQRNETELNHSDHHDMLYRTTPAVPSIMTTSRIRYKRTNDHFDDRDTNVWDVQAPVINAFDVDMDGVALIPSAIYRDRTGTANETVVSEDQYCLYKSTFTFLLVLISGCFLTIVMAVFTFCMRRRKVADEGSKFFTW